MLPSWHYYYPHFKDGRTEALRVKYLGPEHMAGKQKGQHETQGTGSTAHFLTPILFPPATQG